jgi:uncharacterized protein YkwD
VTTSGPTTTGQPAPDPKTPLITFRTLTLIYPDTAVPGQQPTRMSPELTRTARQAAAVTWPKTISDLTHGQVRVVPTVMVMPYPLTMNQILRKHDSTLDPSVWPEDIPQEVKKYVLPGGRYDGVFVWTSQPSGSSWGNSSQTDAKVGWATQSMPTTAEGFGYGTGMMGGTTHEWLHGIAGYFFNKETGVPARLPVCGASSDGVHCGPELGYGPDDAGMGNWLHYYQDLLNGAIGGGTYGLGPKAWAVGVPRARFGGPLDGSDALAGQAPATSSTSATRTSTTSSSSAPVTTTTTSGTTSASAPPAAGVSALEAKAIEATNAKRATVGCKPLVVDAKLQAAARDHASEMVRLHYFAHSSPSGEDPGERAKRFGYTGGVGENIMMGYQGDPVGTINGFWSEGPGGGHHDNIANCGYTRIGLGYDPGNILPAYASGSWAQLFG